MQFRRPTSSPRWSKWSPSAPCWLREHRGGEKREAIDKIGVRLTSIAGHHFGVDSRHYDRLRRICMYINPGETGFRLCPPCRSRPAPE
jgi:hypothetical protein